MFIYIIYGVIFLFMLFNVKEDKKIFFPIFLLLSLNAIRGYSVGTDYIHYFDLYTSSDFSSLFDGFDINDIISNIGQDKSSEIGWGFLNDLGAKFGMPFFIVNLFAIIIILFMISGTVRKQSPNMYFSIYLFLMLDLFFPSFNIIRQSIAVAIFAYSIRYINENKPYLFLLFCLFAFMFHTSALVLPLLYLLKYIKINRTSTIILLIISFVIPLAGLDKYFLSLLFNENTLNVYSQYVEFEGNSSLNEMGLFMSMFLLIIQSLIFIYCYLKLNNSKNIYMILWFIGLLFQNITMYYPWLFRIGGYFLISQIIAMPLVISSVDLNAQQKKTSYSIIIGYSIILYSIRVFINADGIVPYVTLF